MLINLKNIKIIFMGTPEFAVPILNSLIEKYKIISVVTQPDKKVGRKQIINQSPVKKLAIKNNIKVLQPEQIRGNNEFIKAIKELKPDLIIVAAYGLILPKEILNIPQYKVINVHASLLPNYRGASPIQTAILNGDSKTGVTIMLVNEKMDQGDIIAQAETPISPNETSETLHDKLSDLGAKLLTKTLPKYLDGEIEPQKQDDSKASYCQLITKADGKINWQKSAIEIERQVRALNPWPGTWTIWQNKNLKILETEILNPDVGCAESEIGKTFLTAQKELAINCKKGSLLLKKLQLEGKKNMTDKELINGYPGIIGANLK